MRHWKFAKTLVSLLLALIMASSAFVGAFAATPATLTAQEKATEQLIGDVLTQKPSAVRALKRGGQYQAFLDSVATRQTSWVRQERTRVTRELKSQGISPSVTVKQLSRSDNDAARDLYGDLCRWLVDETEDSSVLKYSLFTTPAAIEDFDLSQLIAWSALQDFVDSIVPELLRQALELLRQLGLDVGSDFLWPTLDQKKIVDYAHKYAKNYNPAYRVPDSGSDCTNFVSQALYAGGLSMDPSSIRGTDPGTKTTTEEWYYYNSPSATSSTPYEQAVAVSTSWVRVADLYTYLAPHFDTFTSTDPAAVAANLKEGYVIQGGPSVGRYEHSAIVTYKNGTWRYTAHTNDRKDRDMKHYYSAYDKFRVIKVC